MEFGQFNNEENAHENVLMGETDNSKANEKHNDETTAVRNDN